MGKAFGVRVDSDGESVGALALGASLKALCSEEVKLVALINDGVRRRARRKLVLCGWQLVRNTFENTDFEVMIILDAANLALDKSVCSLFECPASVCAVFDGASDSAMRAPLVVRGPNTSKVDANCGFWEPRNPSVFKREACLRLPQRFAATPLFLLLNGDHDDPLRLVRAANTEPEWLLRRRASLALLRLGPARPWHWWAASIMPLSGQWQKRKNEALKNVLKMPTYDRVEHLRDRASENFAMARAIMLPWLFLLFFRLLLLRYKKNKGFFRTRRRRRKKDILFSWWRCLLDLSLRHLGLFGAALLGFVAANGAPTYHTFFRPSKEVLYERSPAAGAAVFYSTLSAGFVASLVSATDDTSSHHTEMVAGLLWKSRTHVLRLLILLAVASLPVSYAYFMRPLPTLLEALLPLALTFLVLPIVATLLFLAAAATTSSDDDPQGTDEDNNNMRLLLVDPQHHLLLTSHHDSSLLVAGEKNVIDDVTSLFPSSPNKASSTKKTAFTSTTKAS